jgi:Tol biopolymer transport system component
VVLYELAAGKAPFAGANTFEVIAAILEREPLPLGQHKAEVPAELERIVSKALRKDCEERYQTVKDLLLDLKSLKEGLEFRAKLASSGQPAVATSDEQIAPAGEAGKARTTFSAEYLISGIKRHKLGVALGLAALILAGTVFGFYWLVSQRQTKPETKTPPVAPLQTMEMRRLTNTGNITTAAISPDGKYVAYAKLDGGQQSLWLRQVAITSNVQIVPPAKANYRGLTFSRDGNYLYYVKDSTLYQTPVLGGATRKLIANVVGPVTFSPDGQQLAFVRDDPSQGETALIRANADGSGEQKLATRKRPSMIWLESAAWSPGGEIITFSAPNTDASGFYVSVFAVRVMDGTETAITAQRWRHIPSLAWLSDASGLVMIARDRASAAGSPYQVWHLSYPSGEARRITNDLQGYRSISLTADSRALIAVQEDRLINLWTTPPGEPTLARQIVSKIGPDYEPHRICWTPDGKIVYTSFASGNEDLWLTEPDGSNPKQLTTDPGSDDNPSVSPDGRYIVFRSHRSGASDIWRMDFDGSNPKRLTRGNWPDCSSDGQWVVYTTVSSGKSALWKIAIDGGTPVRLTDRHSIHPAISPDGKLIACLYKNDPPDSPTTIAVVPFEGGEPIKYFDHILSPAHWTTYGHALTYIDTREGVSNLWNQLLAGGPPKQLTNFQSETIYSFAWSRDGKRLALTRGVINNDVVLISNFR